MSKVMLQKPVMITLYGFPGSGKSYVARQLGESLGVVVVNADRIRAELFEQPRYDRQENMIVSHLMNYMTEEFLKAGVSVIYDTNVMRQAQRRELRELTRRNHAEGLLIWLQIDTESAFARTQKRDRRTSDDKYAMAHTRETFDNFLNYMQNPKNEDFMVISGKHSFPTQKNAIMNRLYHQGILTTGDVTSSVAKPGLVNLVPNPNAGRVDMSRRNIAIQ